MSDKILSLEDNPRPFGYKKLKETEYSRLGSEDYRIIYSIGDTKRVVKVLSVGDLEKPKLVFFFDDAQKKPARSREGVVEAMAKSAARSIGTQIAREIFRGVLGTIFGRKR